MRGTSILVPPDSIGVWGKGASVCVCVCLIFLLLGGGGGVMIRHTLSLFHWGKVNCTEECVKTVCVALYR